MLNISPITELREAVFAERGIRLFVKRDDLLHGPSQGNKFRKLTYHLIDANHLGKSELLSFGGAYSNHLFALAYYGWKNNLSTTGIVRGEIDNLNPTIRTLRFWGMRLISLSRTEYRQRNEPSFLQDLRAKHPKAYVIPEGGSGELGMLGIKDMVSEVHAQADQSFDFWVCPMATGATAAGILTGLTETEKLWAFYVLKGFDAIATLTPLGVTASQLDRIMVYPADLGGFARRVPKVELFIKEFYVKHGIILDAVYTGRMMYSLYKCLHQGLFSGPGSILILHTGGTQGNHGYNLRFGVDLPVPDFFPIL